jgi:hypothetical protein
VRKVTEEMCGPVLGGGRSLMGQKGCIVALAQEISIADGLVGERSVEGRGRQRNTENHKQTGDETSDATHQDVPKEV